MKRVIFFFKNRSQSGVSKEASPRSFYEKPKLNISLDQQSELFKSLFTKIYQN